MEPSSQIRNSLPRAKLPTPIILSFLALLLLFSANLWARPTSAEQAEKVVRGWLKADVQPLGTALGQQIMSVETFSDGSGQTIYYVVYLQPSGFVIVPADDLVEPIIAFADDGTFDPSPDNPLGALVSRDVPGRIAAVRGLRVATGANAEKKGLTEQQAAFQRAGFKAQGKWAELHDYADMTGVLGISNISDVWVAPIVKSEWGQMDVCYSGWYCYNYYTPNNWPCGCVATAMAQLMRFHQYPVGTYVWSDLVLKPWDICGSLTVTQRQDIGELCYDVAESVNTIYGPSSSYAYLSDARDALLNPFLYTNAIHRNNYPDNIPTAGLNGMVNPNLDANHPVVLGVYHDVTGYGHALLIDGYGYDFLTPYHHLNMGWDGTDDAWYNLPNINSSEPFNTVDSCIYNIFTSGTGEIISGRVTDDTSGDPISGVTVTAQNTGGPYTDETDADGIYALANVPSNETFNVSASKSGWSFSSQIVDTGYSSGSSNTSGNRWGINLVGTVGTVYCSASGGCDEYITDVVVGTINNTGTGCDNYADYTAISTNMGISQSYGIAVTNGNPYSSDQCGIWVDWNRDEDFDDPCETISVSGTPGTGPYTAVITVPADANLGDTRMRIRITYTGTLNPCGQTTYGEVEDYTITVTEAEPNGCKITEGFETGDFNSLPWTHSGNADWTITSSEQNSGTYSAKAGTITHNQSSTLEVTIDCVAGIVTFYRKVSSESDYDYLRFYIDGVEKVEWSGTQNWAPVLFPITVGTRTFKWTYSKDGSVSSGSDTAWIDDIEFPQGIPGDFEPDCDVDFYDFAVLGLAWLSSPGDGNWNPICDISEPNDNIINKLDLDVFTGNWLAGVE